MGKDVVDAFGLAGFEEGKSPVALALEWGVRRLGEKIELRSRAGQVKRVTADVFPAYDHDGGVLVALSPALAAGTRPPGLQVTAASFACPLTDGWK